MNKKILAAVVSTFAFGTASLAVATEPAKAEAPAKAEKGKKADLMFVQHMLAVLKADGTNVVLFAFDAGEELREHTAAIPVLMQTLEGSLEITADGRTVTLAPGDLIHLRAKVPHAVKALQPARFALFLLTAH